MASSQALGPSEPKVKRKAHKHPSFCWQFPTSSGPTFPHYRHTPFTFSQLWNPSIVSPSHEKHESWKYTYDSLRSHPNSKLFQENFFSVLGVPSSLWRDHLKIKLDTCPLFTCETSGYKSLDEEPDLPEIVTKFKKLKQPKTTSFLEKYEKHAKVIQFVKHPSSGPSSTGSGRADELPEVTAPPGGICSQVRSASLPVPRPRSPSPQPVFSQPHARSASPAPVLVKCLPPGQDIYSSESDSSSSARSPPRKKAKKTHRKHKKERKEKKKREAAREQARQNHAKLTSELTAQIAMLTAKAEALQQKQIPTSSSGSSSDSSTD